jgi:hypothetical protein
MEARRHGPLNDRFESRPEAWRPYQMAGQGLGPLGPAALVDGGASNVTTLIELIENLVGRSGAPVLVRGRPQLRYDLIAIGLRVRFPPVPLIAGMQRVAP